MIGEISQRTQACQAAFVKCLASQNLTALEWVENRQGDFNLWASGLKATSGGRSSLDYRVRDRPDVCEGICELLDGLLETLEQLVIVARSESSPGPGTDDIHPEPEYGASAADSGSSGGENDSNSTVTDGEVENPFSEQMENVQTILNQLARISMAIRRSGSKYRHHKADSSLLEEEFDDFKNHLAVLILLASSDAQPHEQHISETKFDAERLTAIQKRLIHANVIRRNRIQYATQRMRQIQESQSLVTAAIQPPPANAQAPRVTHTDSELVELVPPKSVVSKIHSVTVTHSVNAPSIAPTATEIGSEFNLRNVVSRKTPSTMTKITRTGAEQDYPRCPKPTKDGMLQCPYCADVLPAEYSENKARWKGHVAQDILPYICVFDTCGTPDEMYLTSDDLAKHMQKEHSIPRWTCDRCVTKSSNTILTFPSSVEWENHMVYTHAHTFPENQLPMLSKLSRRMMIQPISCPLCAFPVNNSEHSIDEHITQHLHEFALKALPWTGIPDGSSSRKSGAQPSINSHLDDPDVWDGEDTKSWDGMATWSEYNPFPQWINAVVTAGPPPHPRASKPGNVRDDFLETLGSILNRIGVLWDSADRSSPVEKERWSSSLGRIQCYIDRLTRGGHLLTSDDFDFTQNDLSEEEGFLRNVHRESPHRTYAIDKPAVYPGNASYHQRQRLKELRSLLSFRPGLDEAWAEKLTGSNFLHEDYFIRVDNANEAPVHLIIIDYGLVIVDEASRTKYEVSQEPIPLSLLFVETRNPDDLHSQGETNRYPFVLRCLGNAVYSLCAIWEPARNKLFEAVATAKRLYMDRLSSQRALPFPLLHISQTYDSRIDYNPNLRISGIPVYSKSQNEQPKVPIPASFYHATCAATLRNGTLLLGRNDGMLGSIPEGILQDRDFPRSFVTTQIAVLEDFDLVITLAGGILLARSLHVLFKTNMSSKYSELATNVHFFAIATLEGRKLLFYVNQGFINTTCKVVELVLVNKSSRLNRILSRVSLSTPDRTSGYDFLYIDEFSVPGNVHSINIFRKDIALGTSTGFFLLTLPKKTLIYVPNLQVNNLANLVHRIQRNRPISMFWLNSNEFILVYETCAIYIDKHGEICRSSVMEFISKTLPIKIATMVQRYLILFTDEYVEIRDTETGQLRQVIAGKRLRCLDHGVRGPTGDFHVADVDNYNWFGPGNSSVDAIPKSGFREDTVKFSMAIPEHDNIVVVVELVLDPDHVATLNQQGKAVADGARPLPARGETGVALAPGVGPVFRSSLSKGPAQEEGGSASNVLWTGSTSREVAN